MAQIYNPSSAPSGAAGGDLTGTYPNPTVANDKITNAKVNSSAAIAYSKLALTGGIVNADVNASAAIAYSKLALTGGIVNADISSSAAIDQSKLAGRAVAVLASDVGPVNSGNTGTTLTNVTGLSLTIGSSSTERWLVECFLAVSAANTTMDVKLGWTVPASATMLWGSVAGASSGANAASGFGGTVPGTTPPTLATESGTISIGTAAGTSGVPLTALLKSGGTGGTVQLQFAQNTSDASNLSILAGSCLRAVRLAT